MLDITIRGTVRLYCLREAFTGGANNLKPVFLVYKIRITNKIRISDQEENPKLQDALHSSQTLQCRCCVFCMVTN